MWRGLPTVTWGRVAKLEKEQSNTVGSEGAMRTVPVSAMTMTDLLSTLTCAQLIIL